MKWIFSTWANAKFGADAVDASIAGSTADPNGNGVPNLLEYALGSDPLAATSPPLVPVVTLAVSPTDGQSHLMLTATLDATASGITIFGQVSSDLQTWRSGANYVEIVSDSNVGSVRTLILRDLTPIAHTARRFIRLMVTQP